MTPGELTASLRRGTTPPLNHVIGGDLTAGNGEVFTTHNPSDGRALATAPVGDARDIDDAVAAAREALPAWRALNPSHRTRLFLRLAELIEANRDDLAALESLDVGKPMSDAADKDVPTAAECWLYYAGWPTKIQGTTNPAAPNVFSYTLREPVGVVGAITPWNFPMVITSWKVAAALACGNTVVHKPSEDSPVTASVLADLALQAGFPPGVWNVVLGTGSTGAALASHSDVDKVSFTGSTDTGRSIHRAASETLKRLTLELGGKSANIVFDDADLDAALDGAMRATFRNAGQVCTAGGRLVVDRRVSDQFVERLADRVAKLRVGPAWDSRTDVGPLVSRRQRDRVVALYDAALREGATAVCGGAAQHVDAAPDGYYVQPTVFAATSNDMQINQEEIFGPAVAVIEVESEEEAVQVANATPYGLAAGLWTRDADRAHRVARALNAGTVWINMYGGLDPFAAYGGRGLSGHGYELGPQALDEYTIAKTVRQTVHGLDVA